MNIIAYVSKNGQRAAKWSKITIFERRAALAKKRLAPVS